MAAGLTRQGGEMLRQAAEAYGSKGQRQRQGEAELVLASTCRDRSGRGGAGGTLGAGLVRGGAGAGAGVASAGGGVRGGRRPGQDPSEDGEALASLSARRTRSELAGAPSALAGPAPRASVRQRTPARRQDRRAAGSSARFRRRRRSSIRLLERELRAELAVAAGRTVAGLRELRAGLDDFHLWQSSFGSLDLQTNVAGHGARWPARRGLELAVESGEADVLFERSSGSRMVASRVQPVRTASDPQLAAPTWPSSAGGGDARARGRTARADPFTGPRGLEGIGPGFRPHLPA